LKGGRINLKKYLSGLGNGNRLLSLYTTHNIRIFVNIGEKVKDRFIDKNYNYTRDSGDGYFEKYRKKTGSNWLGMDEGERGCHMENDRFILIQSE